MKKHKQLPALASRAAALFFALLLLSESTAASLGSHGVKIAQQPASTPSVPLNAEQQKLYQQGVKLVGEAEELKKKGTKEGYQQAINKYQQALKIVQELRLRAEEAEITLAIGLIYSIFSENLEALKYFNESLKISRELKLPIIEASALTVIAQSYTRTGKPREALTYLKQAESIFRKEKRLDAVASVLLSMAAVYTGLGEIPQTLEPLNQALIIYRDVLKDLPKQATVLKQIGYSHSQMGEPQKALKYYEKALEIQQKSQDLLPAQAETLRYIGSLYHQLGKSEEGLNYLNQARKIQQDKGLLIAEGLTIQAIADIYTSQGDYQKSIEHHKQATILFQKGGNATLASLSLQRIISIYKNYIGDAQKALEFIDEALKLDKKVTGDIERYAVTLNQKADIYTSQGEYQQALEIYNEALDIATATKNKNIEARTLSNLASLYELLGDYDLSSKNYKQALQIYRQIPDKPFELMLLPLIGNLYMTKEEYPEAIKYYNQILSLSREQNNSTFEITGLMGLARVYELQKDFPKALKNAEAMLALSKKNGYKYSEAGALSLIGIINRTKGDYQQSLTNHQKVLSQYRLLGVRKLEAQTLNNISLTYGLSKQYQQAINTLNEELKIRRELKDKTGEADALYLIAINQRKLGNLNAALTNIEAAIQIIENIRSNVKNSDLRTSYFATVQSYYKFKINLLMELHKKDPSKGYNAQAIETSEASRARGLVELLTEARANIRKGANPELLAEERRIQALIDGKEKVRFEIVNSDKINNPIFKANAEKLQTEIDELLSQQKELETKIRQTSPQYANLKYPQPLTLAQIQQQLDKDTLLLQYSLGAERSFLWVVSPNSLDTYELPKKQEIEKSAINLFCLISQNTSKPPSVTNKENPCANIKTQQIDSAAKELSQLILAPVKDKLGTKRLVIVADGALQYIPFSALANLNFQPSSTPQQQDKPKNSCETDRSIFRPCASLDDQSFNYQPLLVNHEIVSLPSASTIAIQRQQLANRPQALQALAILADPVYNATDTRVTSAQNKQLQKQDSVNLELERSQIRRSADILNRDIWTRLLGTRKEAETIFNLVPKSKGVQLLDFAANYTAATSSNLNQFRILHFATHGFVNDANPELSGIVLSLVDKQGKDIRGYLRLADLFNLDYPADLIVLSACETGLGKEIQGEGLVGLTRGLMYAGAERLLVSLWKVSDEGTSEFMQEFYKQMWQQNKSASQALRATQLKMWEQEKWRNPNYWAAFTFLGEWN
ncbi:MULTISPECIES: CHAT domain-containing tetratricopeptide repeat protein [Calothrix]|uniref:Tetratricopeptide repeat protein n=2 Tax=Calothrix TaxID=1186 RepID=A0ABR8A9M6_9CYAN|nr:MULTISPECIES: CHAT domain-containing protein [Calothrix]MBD2196707.1 tetratricopeptide repeat protein [Calothrix parietina FACHB-288]MBD2224196.1 tetratricopeptide repeat protein [Calothrix anomala FACHB-343]